MTAPCIRGCRVPADNGRPIPAPRDDTGGQLCTRCADTLWRWLAVIQIDYSTLSTEILDTGPKERTNTGAPGASPAPMRLDVAALLDPRTTLDPEDRAAVTYPPAAIKSWAQNLLDLTGDTRELYTMSYALEVIREHWFVLLSAPFLLDCWDEIAAITRSLNAAHDRDRAVYLGPCIETWWPASPPWVADWFDVTASRPEGPLDHCLAPVYRAEAGGPITCRTCGKEYGPRDVLALSLTTAEATP